MSRHKELEAMLVGLGVRALTDHGCGPRPGSTRSLEGWSGDILGGIYDDLHWARPRYRTATGRVLLKIVERFFSPYGGLTHLADNELDDARALIALADTDFATVAEALAHIPSGNPERRDEFGRQLRWDLNDAIRSCLQPILEYFAALAQLRDELLRARPTASEQPAVSIPAVVLLAQYWGPWDTWNAWGRNED